VDFVVNIKGHIIPIEVKYSNFKTEKISRSLSSFIFIDTFKPECAIILTKNYWDPMKREKKPVFFQIP